MEGSDNSTNKITSFEEYRQEFAPGCIQNEALQNSLNIRKFEIELYWKRTTYFWSLIVICFTGYFSLLGKDPSSSFLISFLGLMLSFSWTLANKGSKYWQKNWESHVDHLQSECMGPLYRIVLGYDKKNILFSTKSYPFSVSRINLSVSIIICLTWLMIFINSFIVGIGQVPWIMGKIQYISLFFFAVCSIFCLYKCSLPKNITCKNTNFIKVPFCHENEAETNNSSQ